MNDLTSTPGEDESRLDNISTRHSLLAKAHQESFVSSVAARQALVMRYNRAIRSYLGALLRNDQDADEVAQDVVVKILKGDFAGVRPERGRFRDYLKTAVRNAALSHLRRKGTAARADVALLEEERPELSSEGQWLADWRRSVLDGALQALKAYQEANPGNVYATLMQLLTDHPQDDSEQLAARLGEQLGRPVRADAARKQVSRARRKFAELLLEEVKSTLDDPTAARLEQELIEVGLMPFVQDFLPDDWKGER
jgi:RNA polymerase sigma factor (sigma-70 family)